MKFGNIILNYNAIRSLLQTRTREGKLRQMNIQPKLFNYEKTNLTFYMLSHNDCRPG
jgi:hypothetical protein